MAEVTFTTKEMFARVDDKLDQVLQEMRKKADKSEVDTINSRLTTIERHGSPALAGAMTIIAELQKELMMVKELQAKREYLIVSYEEDHKTLASISTWRAMIVGGLIVANAVAVAALTLILKIHYG